MRLNLEGNNNYGRNLGDMIIFSSQLNSTINALQIKPARDEASVVIGGPSTVIRDTKNTFDVVVQAVGNVNYDIELSVDDKVVFSESGQGSKVFSFDQSFPLGNHKLEARLSADDVFSENNEYFETSGYLFAVRNGIIKEFPLKTFFIVLGIIIMGGIVGYFALHYWYKSKYEGYLFRNKRDLYNILQYIHYGKRNGLKDAELENRLKNTGWKKEQINYAIKKYKGENTGIPKLRLGELGGLFKKKANFSKSKSP